ncbi:iron ABC transporter permease [Sinimarinibacterium sp. CAU 1509]|uniref:FecCD family ABC transporter permease n=1 Tax=Sinimarinibacterium sp. CAU 1509 TaxID=2562283 RepID=UPI0010ABC4C7|nr:iron ABC transporter permease [Sinimarinibacterium sp. CAU 1509]TJY60827.1 iron ABC transporter permease [Sinimarinibacterium sp. CAU 1509]
MPSASIRSTISLLTLCTAIGVVTLLALATGPLEISLAQIPALLHQSGASSPDSAFQVLALWQIRVPRIVLAIVVGAALAQSGAAMQGLMRNPLADPGLIGVASGAALAAAAAIVLGTNLMPLPAYVSAPVAAFGGGLAAAYLVIRLSSAYGRTSVTTMLLAGLAINAIAGAGIGFLAYLADDTALRSVTYWMFGSLGKAGWPELRIALPLLLIPLLLIPLAANPLNALQLGEAEAQHLGVDVERLKRRLLALIVIAVAVSVSLAGIVGFVGLIIPHLVRLWFGPDHRRVLPFSALAGSLLLLLADTASRSLFSPAELPIGILTALIGGPFFLFLLMRQLGRETLP